MNLTADQARQQLVLLGGRNQSMQETLRTLLLREPRLTAYLDQLARDFKTASWDIREAGENIHLLYSKIWPAIDFPVVVELPGWPRRRTGRPLRTGE